MKFHVNVYEILVSEITHALGLYVFLRATILEMIHSGIKREIHSLTL